MHRDEVRLQNFALSGQKAHAGRTLSVRTPRLSGRKVLGRSYDVV